MKKKLTYKQIRQIIIDKCIEKSACKPEFKKLVEAKTEPAFWMVIKNNAFWAHENGVISIELFERYNVKKLNENCIFIDGKERELDKGLTAILYNGTVSENNGTVSYNGNNGTVSENNGTVSKNYGTVSENYGKAVVIERQNRKIYIKKGEFEIIYLD